MRHRVQWDPQRVQLYPLHPPGYGPADDVTGQVKVEMFDISGLVTSASQISMFRANKANETACIVSLTFNCKYHFLCVVTIIQLNVISGHQVKKVNQKNRDMELRYMFLGQIFKKNAKMTLKHFLKRQNR